MKKLLIFCVALSMSQLALALPYFRVDPADAKDHFMPSDVITIQLWDNQPVRSFYIEAITDNGIGGIAAEPQLFNGGFDFTMPGTLNYDGKLVVYVAAGVTMPAGPFPVGFLYSFEYHVPDVPMSTIVSIETFADGDLYLLSYIDYADGSFYEGHIDGPVLHYIPEPATLALFALGALLLRRHK